MAKWEAEYNQLMSASRNDDLDYGDMMQNAWQDATFNEQQVQFDDEGLPILGDYTFGTRSFVFCAVGSAHISRFRV